MIKDLFLQKGWAGKTISRAETAERINPILKQHLELNLLYENAARHVQDDGLRARLAEMGPTLRADAGKLAETVYSCGEVAYSGVDLEPEAAPHTGGDAGFVTELLDAEASFADAVRGEAEIEHQMRTRAILGVVGDHAEARLDILRAAARAMRISR